MTNCGSCLIGIPISIVSDMVYCKLQDKQFKEYHSCNLCPNCKSDNTEQSYGSEEYMQCNNCGVEF
jgi:hypothetical protein